MATEPWAAGADETVLRPLVDYWRDGFDWRDRERALIEAPQYVAGRHPRVRALPDLRRGRGTGVSDTLAGGEWADERGYSEQQRTKPDTLAAALVDSPAGLAAWLVEKYRTCSGGAAWRTRVPPVVRRADLP